MKRKTSDNIRPRRWQGTPDTGGQRASVYVGRCGKTEYATISGHLHGLQKALRFAQQPTASTLAWLGGIGDHLHRKIAHAGLCEPRVRSAPADETLAAFVARYIERRNDVGRCTLLNFRQTETQLVKHFGKERSIGSITLGDGKAFRQWLVGEDYALATISMHIKKARQFFQDAVDRDILAKNPFAKVEAGSQVNPERMHYVSTEIVEKVMAVATPELRVVLALARYGGLRCPSEASRLHWEHMLWDKHRFRVKSDKTKRKGKPLRFPPLVGRLYEVLLDAFHAAEEGQSKVLPFIDTSDNLRTQIGRLCERAGVLPWVKPLQNLRLSCETDWMDTDGVANACKWSGNTVEVAMKHYHLVRDVDYLRAAQREGGHSAEHGAERCRIEGNQTEGVQKTTPASEGDSQAYRSVPSNSLAGVSAIIPPRGIEHHADSPVNPSLPDSHCAERGAVDADLAFLVEHWPQLPTASRAWLAGLACAELDYPLCRQPSVAAAAGGNGIERRLDFLPTVPPQAANTPPVGVGGQPTRAGPVRPGGGGGAAAPQPPSRSRRTKPKEQR